MIKTFVSLLVSLSFAAWCAAANAEDLAKSGSISWHTGWKNVGEVLSAAEGHLQGHGSAIGTSFNDNGSGPLHLGPAECVYTFFVMDGGGPSKGYCAFGDVAGDRIFTDWTGEGDSGINVITGGTGKYAGITGSGPYTGSGPSGDNGGWVTFQRLDYNLPN
jgi:hypothetical protein